MKPCYKKGKFDYDSLTVKFGGELSKPENIFTAQAIKVPTYKYTVMEQEDAGGGWYYKGRIAVEYTEDNAYIILRDGAVIGWMKPEHPCHNLKSDLRPIEETGTPGKIKQFAKTLTGTELTINLEK